MARTGIRTFTAKAAFSPPPSSLAGGAAVIGTEQVNAAIQTAINHIPKGMKEAVKSGLEGIFGKSQRMVPVQYGDLKKSGRIHVEGEDSVFDVGDRYQEGAITYGNPLLHHSETGGPIDYAVPVHERTTAVHQVGQALYLKLAIIEQYWETLERMGKEIKKEVLDEVSRGAQSGSRFAPAEFALGGGPLEGGLMEFRGLQLTGMFDGMDFGGSQSESFDMGAFDSLFSAEAGGDALDMAVSFDDLTGQF